MFTFRVRKKIMNMKEKEIVQLALENLHKNVGIVGKWRNLENNEIDFIVDNKAFVVNVAVKNELRFHHLPAIIEQANQLKPLMIVAKRIFPKIKEELKISRIAYLEANGNVFFKQQDTLVWIESDKYKTEPKELGNRAFTKTGLKVVFNFLLDDNFVNLSYREMASLSEVGLGNINYIMNGLKEMGFVLNLNQHEYKLTKKKELLEKWMIAYEERLKPNLKIGTFRFIDEANFNNWKEISLPAGIAVWGAEPASDLLSNYLRPQELTLYTTETRNEIIRNYRLIPDEKGNVKVFQKFWADSINVSNTAPFMLVYADLITMDDKRCRETAQLIYEKHIEPNL